MHNDSYLSYNSYLSLPQHELKSYTFCRNILFASFILQPPPQVPHSSKCLKVCRDNKMSLP